MRVFIPGKMEDNIKVNGLTIKCRDRENSFGQMERNMWANILKIRRKDMENSFGQMERFIKVIGKMENKVDMVN